MIQNYYYYILTTYLKQFNNFQATAWTLDMVELCTGKNNKYMKCENIIKSF